MGFFKWIGSLFSPTSVSEIAQTVREFNIDGDASNALTAQMYIAELSNKTIPIVDAFHKMGRQLMSWGQLAFYAYWAAKYGPETITMELVAGVSGATSIYNLAKGKGR